MSIQGRPARTRRFINDDEQSYLFYQMNLTDDNAVKGALQLLCDHLENDRFPSNPEILKNTIAGLLSRKGVLIRRWGYKALALMGGASEVGLLLNSIKSESDHENVSWAVSALYALNADRSINEICEEAGIELSQTLSLAGLLYLRSRHAALMAPSFSVDIEKADSLTLKWCALLVGYGKAPEHLMHPRSENRDCLSQLTRHHFPEVSEYSVWAFWKNPALSVVDMKRNDHELIFMPENVRRWHNRPLTKDPSYIIKNSDLFRELYGVKSFKAREGLALGIREAQIPQLCDYVVDWFVREEDCRIRGLLLEHMARSKNPSGDFRTMVLDRYRAESLNSPLRQRLRGAAASSGSPLQAEIRGLDASGQLASSSPDLFSGRGIVNTGPTFIATTINATNLAGGDIHANGTNSLQLLKTHDPVTAELLEKVLAFAKSSHGLPEAQTREIITTAEQVALAPTPENKGKLLATLKRVGAVVQAADAVNSVRELIEAAANCF